jgi:hypothetical protein
MNNPETHAISGTSQKKNTNKTTTQNNNTKPKTKMTNNTDSRTHGLTDSTKKA